uniref:Uncharacterized protein n=1 Tax=Lactuca sativa TaxID=4236 RepID=A0A9R1VNW6_LACSA|nr:hypothetical protein LSAT_V11C400157030 [Lactuca sativa]
MQLETELRCIIMGDLTVHEYCNKVKKFTDLLEGLGKKVKERHVVIHALNDLSGKYESLENIIRLSKPLPTFVEMCSILVAEETRLANPRVTALSNDAHPSSSSLIHVESTPSNGGGGGGSSNRRTNRRGGNNNHRPRQPHTPVGQQPTTGSYGWVYIPPPMPCYSPQ